MADPKTIVREGYDRASLAYRGDDYPLERTGYAHWLGRLTPHLDRGGRILDLGCGCGLPVARALAPHFAVTGVDLSQVQVERARGLVPGATFVCADMTAIDYPKASFEAVVAFFSLINLPLAEQPLVIDRVARWLAPGGWFLAVVGKWASTRLEPDFRGVHGTSMFWSHADLPTYRAWFAAAGFAIVEEGSEPRDGNPGYGVLIARSSVSGPQAIGP